MRSLFVTFVALTLGCGEPPAVSDGSVPGDPRPGVQDAKQVKAFAGAEPFHIVLFASEYPSWSAFGVAGKYGLINNAKGQLGAVEKKWNVDIELKMITYETCLTNYGSSGGAICITNCDIVGLVSGRPSTAIMPTSTSFGADACIGTGDVTTLEALRKETTYGLANSVSDYAFFRGLEKLGKNPADYRFQNRDPEQAAQALQTGASKVGMVWNPYTIQTLKNKKDAKIIFNSTIVPGEIVDMVVMDNATLQQPGGDAAAKCICDTFYRVCDFLKSTNKTTSDDTYATLSDQFVPATKGNQSFGAEDMKLCVDMASNPDETKKITTRFYDTPELGTKVFGSANMEPILAHVLRWAKVRQLIKKDLTISYPDTPLPQAGLTFDTKYMQEAR